MQCKKCKFSENFDKDFNDAFDCKLRPLNYCSQWGGGTMMDCTPVCLLDRFDTTGAFRNCSTEDIEYLKTVMGIDMVNGTWMCEGEIRDVWSD